MTFVQYWVVLMKRWHIVLLCFFVVGIGAFVGSKLIKPVYQSSTLVQVAIRSGSSNPADYNNLQASDQLVQTEADLALNYSVLSIAAAHYPGMTAGQLAAETSSTTKLNTQLFEIDVQDYNPERAASLANAVAAALIQQQQASIDQGNVKAQQQIEQNMSAVSQQINTVTVKISALQASGNNQSQIALLQTQLNALQQQYNQWQSALTQLELSQAQSGNPLLIVQTALPNTTPVKPNVRLYTAGGFLVGLLLGALLVLLSELVDTRVRTPEKIIQLLGWPVLTSIFRVASSKLQDVINLDKQKFNVEPLHLLHTNIGFSGLDRPLHSMIVTSAQKGDGKSVIAANLAILMARTGKSTLLIDADLRSPVQHTLFNLPPHRLGLTDALLALNGSDASVSISQPPSYHQFMMKNTNPQSSVGAATNGFSLTPYIHAVNIPNLWVMPSGPLPPRPSEFLESKVMQRFLAVIENCGVEIVIFDVPPLLGLSDASILASKVDGALVVIDTTRATKDKLKQIKAALMQTGVHVLGCVANKVSRKGNENTYFYYAEDQAGVEKRNGYVSTASGFSGSVEHSVEQNMR